MVTAASRSHVPRRDRRGLPPTSAPLEQDVLPLGRWAASCRAHTLINLSAPWCLRAGRLLSAHPTAYATTTASPRAAMDMHLPEEGRKASCRLHRSLSANARNIGCARRPLCGAVTAACIRACARPKAVHGLCHRRRVAKPWFEQRSGGHGQAMCATLWRSRLAYLALAEALVDHDMSESPLSRMASKLVAQPGYRDARRRRCLDQRLLADGGVSTAKAALADLVDRKRAAAVQMRAEVCRNGSAPMLCQATAIERIGHTAAELVHNSQGQANHHESQSQATRCRSGCPLWPRSDPEEKTHSKPSTVSAHVPTFFFSQFPLPRCCGKEGCLALFPSLAILGCLWPMETLMDATLYARPLVQMAMAWRQPVRPSTQFLAG